VSFPGPGLESLCVMIMPWSAPMPRALRYGAMTRLPPFDSAEYDSPVSYSKRWPLVSISSAIPWPTSKAVTATSPSRGCDARLASSGSHATAPTQRRGQPRGASIQKVPPSAKQKIHGFGAGAVHTREMHVAHPSQGHRQRFNGGMGDTEQDGR
jgi:hypothetical protein